MPASEVENPIINSPYEEPTSHWKIHEHEPAEKISGRREPTYMYLPPGAKTADRSERDVGYELKLDKVSLIRRQLAEWRPLALRGEGGVSRVTMELLNYWRREGREQRLFFAQLEAAETIIFLKEARADFLQGITIPSDEPGEEKLKKGFTAYQRYCCKMATGAGKTTVMAMLAAWSVLNKVNNKGDQRFSDSILVVCPNVTIRDRLAELNPQKGEASIYRTRDLVPPAMMPQLTQGRFLTLNWHVFEPHSTQSGGKVVKAGQRKLVRDTVFIGDKTTTARGNRYMTEDSLRRQNALGLVEIRKEIRDKSGTLKKVEIVSEKYSETDTAIVRRVLGNELGERKNILVFNDEAHHAYRLRATGDGESDEQNEIFDDDETSENDDREATVWVDGLDRVNKLRDVNFCVDFSATPYFLGRVGDDTNRIFPWTVSDFGLQDAIESGLVKIPQLAVRDSSGKSIPGYFNIWKWILPQLSQTERGGAKKEAKPEAILKYAHTPIAMLGGMWEKSRQEFEKSDDPRPPVFILVCKTRKLAKIVYEWLADDRPPTTTIPRVHLPELRNSADKINTICVYSDVQKEIESDNTQSDENRWMRHTLGTIGRINWPQDRQERPQYPDGFEELAEKLGREKHPPGRDVRCIVSVGMLTEGWDCNTVTHIIGLRPFMSQLLCEQVIGRGLRRVSYQVGEDGLMSEEIATVLGVPLTSFTVKSSGGESKEKQERHHIFAIPARAKYAISFPRIEGYRQTVRRRIICRMENISPLTIDGTDIPPEVQMIAGLPGNSGRLSLHGPGKVTDASLQEFRQQFRLQEKLYEMTTALTNEYASDITGDIKYELPPGFLFSQLYQIVRAFIADKVSVSPPSDIKDAFLAPYYGWIIETLRQNIRPDESADETPELPRYERLRGNGSTSEVDFFTLREPYPVQKSHINAVVPDTKRLEQSTAYRLDKNPHVFAFAKNEGMGFGIPYLHNGEPHDYMPDFLIRLHEQKECYLILETKGFDPLKEVKKSAAERWVDAVNADRAHGRWRYCMVSKVSEIDVAINQAVAEIC